MKNSSLICPGEIVKLDPMVEIPFDCILVKTENAVPYCFLSTLNTDCQDHLVQKSIPDIYEYTKESDATIALQKIKKEEICCEPPNPDLYSWSGVMSMSGKSIPLSVSNFFYICCNF